jgi:hypothetical protein
MQTISPFKHVRTRFPTAIRLYQNAGELAEPDTVEMLYDFTEEICDAIFEVVDQLQQDVIGVK